MQKNRINKVTRCIIIPLQFTKYNKTLHIKLHIKLWNYEDSVIFILNRQYCNAIVI